MTNPLQSLSNSIKNSSNQDPPPPSENPSQVPIPPLPTGTSTPGPKRPTTIPSAPTKANPTQKTAESRPLPQTLPTQHSNKQSAPQPKGASAQATKTVAALGIRLGTDVEEQQEPQIVEIPNPAIMKARARDMLLLKAVKAQEEGDKEKANRFFAMHESLLKESTTIVAQNTNEIQVKTSTQVIPQKRPSAAGGTTESRGIKFIWSNSNSHDDGGFTPYFHKNICELKGPIPLTIFNRKWQEEALSYHSRNRAKTDETAAEKGLWYHGLAVPDEWLQSFADWTLNHRCFYETIKDQYNFPVLAEWILIHKENCDKLQRKHGFMVALRYDIRIQNNVFAFRVERDGEESFSNISEYKPDTADDAHAESRDLNELGVWDNPYAIGGAKFGYDPHSGLRISKAPTAPTKTQPQPAHKPTDGTIKPPSSETSNR
ncbi:hypothetical protein PGTUg99_023172 [Puccinia graminis f. sp. tritici]|uniref:Uncharacterized protein n=1 Tax=Puccinia graminis f. sp. tritici TaxID=56615 RepID=A0A5B0R6Q1_PUCGR|nr:hypothetical protein PGTUg99_023172 [Puccinia graminis f. sp. tritici]